MFVWPVVVSLLLWVGLNLLSVFGVVVMMLEKKNDLLFSDGKYLGFCILAVSGDWLVVFDGRFNYMVFDCCSPVNVRRFNSGRLPCNNSCFRCVAFRTSFDSAVKRLCQCVVNDGF